MGSEEGDVGTRERGERLMRERERERGSNRGG